MKKTLAILLLALGLALLFLSRDAFKGTDSPAAQQAATQTPPPLPAPYLKLVTFSICEDYDNGQDLQDIAQDFKLLGQLGIDEMRVSFGWDDYEPERGKYDFSWLHKFAILAQQHNIKLRPYICYAPKWATGGDWNLPPKDFTDWYNFCHKLAAEMKVHPNIVSWEIWNEENDATFWWQGSPKQFHQLLEHGAKAIRAADPGKTILLGGLTFPDDDWLDGIVSEGYSDYYDVLPLHCYAETWGEYPAREHVENYLTGDDYKWLVADNKLSGNKPIWINEIGYSTMRRTETQQANYMCRSVAHLLAVADIKHIGWYEVKDQKPNTAVIGDAHNFHLGITRYPDRKPKLAFHTLDMLTDLLDGKEITPARPEAAVTVIEGKSQALYHQLFKLADGSQLLFVYSKDTPCTVNVTLKTPGQKAVKYELDNTHAPYPGFTNNTLDKVALKPGEVQVFKITP